MFVIKNSEDATIEWPVSINVARDGGKTQKFEFVGVFRRLSADEKDAMPKIADDATADEVIEGFIDRALRHMVSWRGVVDNEQKAVELNEASLRAAIRSPGGAAVIAGITRAIQEVETGEKRKN